MLKHRRNGAFADWWSLTHVGWAMLLAWVMNPLIALIIMVLWEPIEVFVLSPFLARFGIDFGYENLVNSLSDICFDVLGIILGAWVLTKLIDPPFHLF
jgi:hypothetical protein